MSDDPAQKIVRNRTLLICILLAIGTVGLFSSVQTFEFVGYDDPSYITSNPYVKAGLTTTGLKWAFGNIASDATYWHPLTWISHMLDVQLFGLNSGAHHLVNLLFHTANVLLLFLLLKRLTKTLWQSALVAALFAWHPLQVETVSWVTERKNVLSTLFLLLTIWAYSRYVEKLKTAAPETSSEAEASAAEPALERGEARVDVWLDTFATKMQTVLSMREYQLVVVLFALGLMCKPMLVTLPCVLLLLDFWPLGRLSKVQSPMPKVEGQSSDTDNQLWNLDLRLWTSLVMEKIPLFVCAAVSSWITLVAHQHLQYFLPTTQASLAVRLANVITSYSRYIEKTFWPTNLCAIYPYSATVEIFQFAAAGLCLAGISWWAISSARQRPYLCFGWLWFLGTLVPVIGLVQVGGQAMADRFAYVPLIGLLIMVVWGAFDLLGNFHVGKIILTIMAFAVLEACMLVSQHQMQFWENSFTLFNRALAVTKDNSVAHYNLGYALMLQGKNKAAKAHYHEAIRISPGYSDARNNYAAILVSENKVDEAMRQYSEMLRYTPKNSLAHYNLGALLDQQGKPDEALTHYRAALDYNPSAEAHITLGNALAKMGKMDEAVEHIIASVRLDPASPQANFSAGMAMMKLQRGNEGIKYFSEAIRLKPDYAEARYNFGNALAMSGQFEQALQQFAETVRLQPKTPEIYVPLALALAQVGRKDEAAKTFRKAIELAEAAGQKELAARIQTQASQLDQSGGK